MSYGIYQSWKIILPLGSNSPNYLTSNKIFNVVSGKSFMRCMGGGMENFPLKPDVLTPTSAFNDALLKFSKPLGINGKKLPYTFKDSNLNIKINCYFGKYVVITATLDSPIEISLNDAESSNKLKDTPEIYKFLCGVCGIILSGNHKVFSPLSSIPSLPCCRITELSSTALPIPNSTVVSALTGHIGATDNIVKSVILGNEDHQVNRATTLVDKQGVLQRVPYSLLNSKEAKNKFRSCCALFELCAVIDITLSDKYLDTNNYFINSVQKLVNDSHLITKSVTAQKTISVLVKTFRIKDSISHIPVQAPVENEIKTSIVDRIKSHVWTLRDTLIATISLFVAIYSIFKPS
ncbi:hypothetical protein AB6C58_16005 [Vibrio splendidus]